MTKTKKFKAWEANVEEWIREYGEPANKVVNLTRINSIRRCNKCGRTNRVLQRHHKGHEYLFASILPDKYAARYIQFRREDIILLCQPCHKRCDKTHYPIIGRMFKKLGEQDGKLTYKQCEYYRKLLVARTMAWLIRGNKCLTQSQQTP